jgi:(p)ppGpp synthase/HD superfamily hydrolase
MSIEDAIQIAAEVHSGQKDKGGAPYILHPLRVMAQMDTDQERIVALLHDAVEDCDWYNLGEVELYFGTRIAAAVDALTKRKGESYDAYLNRVKADEIAVKVKMADLMDNCDMSRLGREPTKEDRARLYKYLAAQIKLQNFIDGKEGK